MEIDMVGGLAVQPPLTDQYCTTSTYVPKYHLGTQGRGVKGRLNPIELADLSKYVLNVNLKIAFQGTRIIRYAVMYLCKNRKDGVRNYVMRKESTKRRRSMEDGRRRRYCSLFGIEKNETSVSI